MPKRLVLPAVIVVVFATLLAACVPLGSILLTQPVAPKLTRTVILTAVAATDANHAETQPFLAALQNRVDRTADSTYCNGVYEGEIYGQPVVVVTTGTGADNTGPCMQELLYQYRPQVQ